MKPLDIKMRFWNALESRFCGEGKVCREIKYTTIDRLTQYSLKHPSWEFEREIRGFK